MTTVQELIALLSEPEVVNALVEQFAETGTKVSELTPLTDPVGTDLAYIVDVSAGVAGSKSIDLDTLFGNVPSALTLKQATGVTVDPGSDVDAVVASVAVTGSPSIGWSEISDAFTFSHNVAFAGSTRVSDGEHIGVPVSADALVTVNDSLYYSTDQNALTYKYADGNAAPISKTIYPTGDAATDTAAIQAAIDNDGLAVLGHGTFNLNDSIKLNKDNDTIRGQGDGTLLNQTNAAAPCILFDDADYLSVIDLSTEYGTHGILTNSSHRNKITRFTTRRATQGGIVIDGVNGGWIYSIHECHFEYGGGGYAIQAVTAAGSGASLCNAISITNSYIENYSGGVHLGGCAGGNITGCCIEGSGVNGAAVKLSCEGGSTSSVNITGNYFEANGTASIEIHTYATWSVIGVNIDANFSNEGGNGDTPFVWAHDETGLIGRARGFRIGPTNTFSIPAAPVKAYEVGRIVRNSEWAGVSLSNTSIDPSFLDYQVSQTAIDTQQTETITYTVACGEDGTAKQPELLFIEDGSTIHEISARCVTAMNGTGDRTFSVGIAGTGDKYIASADFNPASVGDVAYMIGGTNNVQKTTEMTLADQTIIAEWTNTGGTPSAGSIEVRITFSRNTYYNQSVSVPE